MKQFSSKFTNPVTLLVVLFAAFEAPPKWVELNDGRCDLVSKSPMSRCSLGSVASYRRLAKDSVLLSARWPFSADSL